MTERAKSPDYVLLDLDRTLLNTEAVMLSYVKLIGRYDANLSNRLYWAWRQAEDMNESFDARAYLDEEVMMERSRQDAVDQFDQAFATASHDDEDFLNNGAAELLQGLEQRQIPHGILTYGSPTWQGLKLSVSGLGDLPHLVTQQRQKGRVITSWAAANGEIKLPTKLTKRYRLIGNRTLTSVILVDDRLEALVGLPAAVDGYWYTDKESKPEVCIASEAGKSQIGIINHLQQVLDIV